MFAQLNRPDTGYQNSNLNCNFNSKKIKEEKGGNSGTKICIDVIMLFISDGNSVIASIISVFDLFKAFSYIESSHKLDFFPSKRSIFLYACETFSELLSNSIMHVMMNIISLFLLLNLPPPWI